MGSGCWLVITYQERGLLNLPPTWHTGPPSVRRLRSIVWPSRTEGGREVEQGIFILCTHTSRMAGGRVVCLVICLLTNSHGMLTHLLFQLIETQQDWCSTTYLELDHLEVQPPMIFIPYDVYPSMDKHHLDAWMSWKIPFSSQLITS